MTTLLPRGPGAPRIPDAPASRPAPRPGGRPSAPPSGARRPVGPVRVLPGPPAPNAPVAVRSRPRLPFAALILLLLGGGLCTLLALNTASAAGEVQERELADQARTLSDTEQDLRRDVAGLEAPAALATAAGALGMVPGDHPAFLVIAPDGTVTVLGDPQAAPLPVPPPDPNATPTPDPNATPAPTAAPTPDPSATPTPDPNAAPAPTAAPTPDPNAAPTPDPSATPTADPNPAPTADLPTSPPAGQ